MNSADHEARPFDGGYGTEEHPLNRLSTVQRVLLHIGGVAFAVAIYSATLLVIGAEVGWRNVLPVVVAFTTVGALLEVERRTPRPAAARVRWAGYLRDGLATAALWQATS